MVVNQLLRNLIWLIVKWYYYGIQCIWVFISSHVSGSLNGGFLDFVFKTCQLWVNWLFTRYIYIYWTLSIQHKYYWSIWYEFSKKMPFLSSNAFANICTGAICLRQHCLVSVFYELYTFSSTIPRLRWIEVATFTL